MSELRPEREHDELVGRFDAYASAAVPQFTAPPLPGIELRQRRRRRVATLGVALAVTTVLVAAGVAGRGLLRPGTGTPVGSPPAAGPLTPGPLARKNLADSTVELPTWPRADGAAGTCPATGAVRFAGGSATVGGLVYQLSDNVITTGASQLEQPLSGRLTGLADEVRVVRIDCQRPGVPGSDAAALLALVEKSDGGLRGLGYLSSLVTDRPTGDEVGFADGSLVVELERNVGSTPYAQRRVFRWTGSALSQVSGPTSVPSRLNLADVDAKNWAYDTSGFGNGADMIACIPMSLWLVVLRDGVGNVRGVPQAGGKGLCSAGTARLLVETAGAVRGAGPVKLVTLALELDGRPPVVGVYAFYERAGALVAQLVDSRTVESVQPPRVQRVSGDRLELTLKTAAGEATFRWQWSARPSLGLPAGSFVPAS